VIIESTRFGLIEISDEQLLSFPDGLPGLPDLHRVAVLNAGVTDPLAGIPGADDLFWLQDADSPEVAFLVASPWTMFPDYEIDANLPGVDDPDSLVVMVILTVRETPSGLQVTANLRAPLLVDPLNRQGFQVILEDPRWLVRTPMRAEEAEVEA
jgi:flagellar assembly factor FliW